MKFCGGFAKLAGVATLALWPSGAFAQSVDGSPQEASVSVSIDASHPGSDVPLQEGSVTELTLPKLTPVVIELLDPVGSKSSKSLDTFRIALLEPIAIDGVEIIPAGTTGMGEVVHAKKAGGSGGAGELVLAARFLNVGGKQLLLRSMKIDAEGESRTDTVNTIAVASAATIAPIAVVGFFIKGGEVEIPAGARAHAKVAANFAITVPHAGKSQEIPTDTGVSGDSMEGIIVENP